MHHQRTVTRALPYASSSLTQARTAATAANIKPRSLRQDSQNSSTLDLAKWAPIAKQKPTPTPARTANTSTSFDSSSTLPGSSPSFRSVGQAGSSSTFRPPTIFNRPPPHLHNPPSSSALDKWAPKQTQTARRPQVASSPSADDFRLQRGLAPHQLPNTRHGALRLHRDPTPQRPSANAQNTLPAPRAFQDAHASEQPEKLSNRLPQQSLDDQHATPNSQLQKPYSGTRVGKTARNSYKDRGSLARADAAIPSHSKPNAAIQKPVAVRPKKVRNVQVKKLDVYIPSTVSVGQLARILNIRLERLQQKMKQSGLANEATYDYVLTSDYAVLLAEEFNRNPIVDDEAAFDVHPPLPLSDVSSLPYRPPVVTIMGHVDHGKTTLLDTLRSSTVAKGEAGGITQHIGAFSVPVPPTSGGDGAGPSSITFLDTPGHAAFSAMRARGADVTDIIVLVVAADDGIMPQTKEVIELSKKSEGKIGLVVAVNKIDKPGADTDAVERALLVEGIQLEAYGGDVPSVHVSGLTGDGLPNLVETLSAMAEMQDLHAEREGNVYGHVLESKVQKGLGPVATVLIQRGCLKLGSHLISGANSAKVRVMNDSTGANVKVAYPGMAVTVSGWKTLPNAGDDVIQASEADVKKALANRIRRAEIEASVADVDAVNEGRRQEREKRESEKSNEPTDIPVEAAEEGPKELRLIIKADVSGSAEAVKGALEGIGNKLAITKIISSGVGDISESDIMMAKAANATVVGFSVSTPRAVEILATQNSVPICTSPIIYRLMEEVQNRVIALLPVIRETKVTGEATVLQLFDIHLKAKQIMKVAGCRVINGIVEKSKFARVIRDGATIHEGLLDTMRILKKDVTEVRKGSECGLSVAEFSDLREGDLIQMYDIIEKPGNL